MTGSLQFLSEIRDMILLPVKLPDGRITLATRQGTFVLSSLLTLQDVLFVDGLHCHFVSVSQLTRSKTCLFQSTDKICLIQDCISKMMIGVAQQLDGLYFLRRIEFVVAMAHVKQATTDTWHLRLGYPSSSVFDFLPFSEFSHSTSLSNKVCETCICAKKTRCPFPSSSNKTTILFELVHCDLWGPCRTTAHRGARYFLIWLMIFPQCLYILAVYQTRCCTYYNRLYGFC